LTDILGENPVVDRGAGVICKWMPDAAGPDFACLEAEWCFDGKECRCGTHGGCQQGERCVPSCEGNECPEPTDYHCEREVPCESENLDDCAAQPGQLCVAGADECSVATDCSFSDAGAELGATCGDDCCAPGEWCFDDAECRCGVDEACGDGDSCELNSVGYYECSSR
jgi:hypothetical protein